MQHFSLNAPYSWDELRDAIAAVERRSGTDVPSPSDETLFAAEAPSPAAEHLRLSSLAAAEFVRRGLLPEPPGAQPLLGAFEDGNRNAVVLFWWGYELYLENDGCDFLVTALAAGWGVSEIARALAEKLGGGHAGDRDRGRRVLPAPVGHRRAGARQQGSRYRHPRPVDRALLDRPAVSAGSGDARRLS